MASITIVGTGFSGATQCFFGTVGVAIRLNAAGTSFTCIPPAGTPGGVSLSILGYSIGTGEKGYTYVGTPTISSLGITNGSIYGWTPLYILGSNFYNRSMDPFPGYTCGVSFGNTVGTVVYISNTAISYVYSPPGATIGPVQVKIITPTGISKGFTFNYFDDCSPCPILSPDSLGCSGATGSCLEIHDNPGCDCCKCCDAVCRLDPQCCNPGWSKSSEAATCRNLILETTDPNSDIYKNCVHLRYGACCVKFNNSGISYSICLGSRFTTEGCSATVVDLHANNSNTFPWNLAYTSTFATGGTCSACTSYCNNNTCLILGPGGMTCSNCQSSPCCFYYGYCSTGCTCSTAVCPGGKNSGTF